MEGRTTLIFCFIFFLLFSLFSNFVFGEGGSCLQYCAVLGRDPNSVFSPCVTEKPLSSYLTGEKRYTVKSFNSLEPDSCIRHIFI